MSRKKTAATFVSALFVSAVFLSGCGLFNNEATVKIDPPKDVNITNDNSVTTVPDNNTGTTANGTSDQTKGMVQTELYLIDKNGYVVPKTMDLPKTNSVAQQALDYLVADGPISNLIPSGFRAVLPAGTVSSVNVKDGVASVDFSKEFKNYLPDDELKILQSITWTLTQFNSIKSVKLSMAGKPLTQMPVAGTPINGNLSRADGINIDISDVLDITNTHPVTVYYIGGDEGSYYYVPVTCRVSNDNKNDVTAIVDKLIKGPSESSNLVTDFMPDTKLLNQPKVENGEVTLNFNNSIYGSFKQNVISQHLLDELVLSLTEEPGINRVAVEVNGQAKLVKENGQKLTAPVTRQKK